MPLQRPSLPKLLLLQIEQHQVIERALLANLPADLAAQVFFINLRGGTLIVGCKQQSLMTRLRFAAPQILAAVNAILPEPSAQRLAVRASQAPSTTRQAPARLSVSPHAEQVIEQNAACIEDAALRHALQKLARTLGGRKKAPDGA